MVLAKLTIPDFSGFILASVMQEKELKAKNTIHKLEGRGLLLLCAMIWGSGFVAQRLGMRAMGSFSYMWGRYLLGGLILLPGALRSLKTAGGKAESARLKAILPAALSCGLLLFTASSMQQAGLQTTTASRAGFLTSMYLIFVPLIGLVLGRRPRPEVWLAVLMAVAGVYLLSVREKLALGAGDLILLMSAFFWAVHIIVIDYFNQRTESIWVACGQSLVCGILAGTAAMIFEKPCIAQFQQGFWAVAYSGVFVVAIAYTFQILGQKKVSPNLTAIIFSTEAVWALVFGAIFLHERLSPQELIGCALILGATIIVQIPWKKDGQDAQEQK